MQATPTHAQATWRRAAVLGSVWGASEVVFGSFLHNLQLPLRGYILTFMAIALLVAAHRVWPVRGLFWRAGMICAAMKTLSPSPAIFGPMLAIAVEAALLEVGFALGLRKWPGYLLGGALAMAWPLAQKALNLLIVFGGDVVELYARLVGFASKNLGAIGFWTPILALLALTTIAGSAAAAFGLRVGERARSAPTTARERRPVGSVSSDGRSEFRFPFSRRWLLVQGAGLVVVLVILELGGIGWGSAATGAFLVLSIRRYGRFLRRLFARPGLWLTFAAVTVLAAWAMGSRGGRFSAEGLESAAAMLLRAIAVLAGFVGLSTELRDPALGRSAKRAWMREFLFACRLAFRALPVAIERLPGVEAWRRPSSVLVAMVNGLDALLEEATPRAILVTGEKGEGKTTLLARYATELRKAGARVAGLLAHAVWERAERSGYDVESIATGERVSLAVRSEAVGAVRQGPFAFSEVGLTLGISALTSAIESDAEVVVVDEVGPLELRGEGWAEPLDRLLAFRGPLVVLSVRPSLVEEVGRRWAFVPLAVVRASEEDAYGTLERFADAPQSR